MYRFICIISRCICQHTGKMLPINLITGVKYFLFVQHYNIKIAQPVKSYKIIYLKWLSMQL